MAFRARRFAPRAPGNRRQVELLLAAYGGTHSGGVLKACDWLVYPSDQNWPAPGQLTGTPQGIVTLPNMTLIHTRVNMFGQTGSISLGAWSALAIGILEWERRTTSVPAVADVPSPLNDSADWIWQLEVPITKAPAAQTQSFSLVDGTQIHSKAMRKLPTGSGILIISEYVNIVAPAYSIEFNTAIQMRFKLPK